MSREDMNIVLDEGMATAIHLLVKSGELFPFAVVRSGKGGVRHVQTSGEDQRPSSDEVIRFLRSMLRRAVSSGEYRTTAILSVVALRNQETGEATDAIRAEIEDSEAEPVTCYLPFVVRNGAVETGEIQAEAGSRVLLAEWRNLNR